MATIDPRLKLLLCIRALMMAIRNRPASVAAYPEQMAEVMGGLGRVVGGVGNMDAKQTLLPETATLAFAASLENNTLAINNGAANASLYANLAADSNAFAANNLE